MTTTLTSGANKSLCKEKTNTEEVMETMENVKWENLALPNKNKGYRGIELERALEIPTSSALKDMSDGELKTFKMGQTIAVTMLNHCLEEILESEVDFSNSIVGKKLSQTVYVGFDKSGKQLCKRF